MVFSPGHCGGLKREERPPTHTLHQNCSRLVCSNFLTNIAPRTGQGPLLWGSINAPFIPAFIGQRLSHGE